MEGVVEAVQACMQSDTVGSVIACSITASLVGHREDTQAVLRDAIPKLMGGLRGKFASAWSFPRPPFVFALTVSRSCAHR